MVCHLTHLPLLGAGLRERIAADATCVDCVGFLQFVDDTVVLGDVAVGQVNVTPDELRPVVQLPTHYRHHRGIAERSEVAFQVKLDLPFVISVMTSFAERHEVVGTVAAGLA